MVLSVETTLLHPRRGFIKLEDTVESQETDPARDPEGGRDTGRDFMIRYSGS